MSPGNICAVRLRHSCLAQQECRQNESSGTRSTPCRRVLLYAGLTFNFLSHNGRKCGLHTFLPLRQPDGGRILTKRRIAECLAHTRRSISSTLPSKTPPSTKRSAASTECSAQQSNRKSRIGDGASSPTPSVPAKTATTSFPS